MSQRGRRAIKGILIGLVLIALVVGYYFYLSNRKPKEAAEDTETTVSAVQKLLLKNIDDDYFEELENILIMADIGVNTTSKIIENLQQKVKEQKN